MNSFNNYLATLNIHVRVNEEDEEKPICPHSKWNQGRGMELQDSLSGFMNYKKSKIV